MVKRSTYFKMDSNMVSTDEIFAELEKSWEAF